MESTNPIIGGEVLKRMPPVRRVVRVIQKHCSMKLMVPRSRL